LPLKSEEGFIKCSVLRKKLPSPSFLYPCRRYKACLTAMRPFCRLVPPWLSLHMVQGQAFFSPLSLSGEKSPVSHQRFLMRTTGDQGLNFAANRLLKTISFIFLLDHVCAVSKLHFSPNESETISCSVLRLPFLHYFPRNPCRHNSPTPPLRIEFPPKTQFRSFSGLLLLWTCCKLLPQSPPFHFSPPLQAGLKLSALCLFFPFFPWLRADSYCH